MTLMRSTVVVGHNQLAGGGVVLGIDRAGDRGHAATGWVGAKVAIRRSDARVLLPQWWKAAGWDGM